jgi:hypothetical protein
VATENTILYKLAMYIIDPSQLFNQDMGRHLQKFSEVIPAYPTYCISGFISILVDFWVKQFI